MFVYGATGAGKTHTMLGSMDNPGLTFQTVMALYSRMKEAEAEEGTHTEVAVSYVEIYNEQVIDLINPGVILDPDSRVVKSEIRLRSSVSAWYGSHV